MEENDRRKEEVKLEDDDGSMMRIKDSDNRVIFNLSSKFSYICQCAQYYRTSTLLIANLAIYSPLLFYSSYGLKRNTWSRAVGWL